MKRLHFLLIGLLIFASTACQKHSPNEVNLLLMPGEPPIKVPPKNATAAADTSTDQSQPAPKYY